MEQSLKHLEAEIAKIQKKAAPLREKLIEASLELEKHRNAYHKIKDKLLPKIREIEGEPDPNGQNTLSKLMRERNALLRAGAGRTE